MCIRDRDYASYLMKQDMLFDLAFLDPPYHKGILEKALPLTAKVMNEDVYKRQARHWYPSYGEPDTGTNGG